MCAKVESCECSAGGSYLRHLRQPIYILLVGQRSSEGRVCCGYTCRNARGAVVGSPLSASDSQASVLRGFKRLGSRSDAHGRLSQRLKIALRRV